jgi:hypothetical protein
MPIAILVALLYLELAIGGLLLSILPLVFIREAYLAKHRLMLANQDLLYALVKAIETRDPYTSVTLDAFRTSQSDLGSS